MSFRKEKVQRKAHILKDHDAVLNSDKVKEKKVYPKEKKRFVMLYCMLPQHTVRIHHNKCYLYKQRHHLLSAGFSQTLHIDQFEISPAPIQQFLMGTVFHNAALIKHLDHIGLLNGT